MCTTIMTMAHIPQIIAKNTYQKTGAINRHRNRACRRVARLLMTGRGEGRFHQFLDLFQGLKIGVTNGCLGESAVFKILIDDVTLWSKLEPIILHGKTYRFY